MRVGLKTAIPAWHILTAGGGSIELLDAVATVDVDFDYTPATPDNDEGPGDVAQVKVKAILLHESLALHDKTDTMTLVLSAGTDLTELLPERTLESISEQVLRAVEKQP